MVKQQLIKSLNDELRQATYVCMIPGEDAHGDNVDTEEIRKACHAFNKSKMKANLFHKMMTNSVSFVESYTTPVAFEIQDSDNVIREIPKGTWLVVTKTESDEIWAAQKDGRISGVSINAMGTREEVEE